MTSHSDAASWIPRVAAAALASFADTMSFLGLANGKHQGPEYLPLNPRRPDNSPGSFSINTITGAWGDFAIGASGLDLVSLAAYLGDEKQSDAARRLAQHFGIAVPARKDGAAQAAGDPGKARAPTTPPKPRQGPQNGPAHSAGECVLPVPDDAPSPPQSHSKLGKVSRAWEYRDAAGRLLFLVCRFDQAAGGKEIRPLSLRRTPAGKLEWRWLGVDPLRPPYGLDRLAARPGADVVITEGEKAADAAGLLFPDHVAITSPNGAKAADKTDWSALAGRRCILWPDADEAGEAYAAEVSKRLHAASAAEVLRLNSAAFLTLPDGTPREALPAGWDAADAASEGYTAALVAERLAALPDAFPIFEKAAPAAGDPAKVGAGDTAKPKARGSGHGFYVDARGVWAVGTNKDGEPTESKVCSTLDVVARARTADYKAWGKLVEFIDHDRQQHREVIPDAMLSGDGADIGKLLRGLGLWIAPGRNGNARLLEFLNSVHPKERARTTARTGWHESEHGRVFVLPDRAIGKADEVWLFEDGAPSPCLVASADDASPIRCRPAAPARLPAQSRRLPTNPQAPRHRYRLAWCAAPSRDEAASRLCAFAGRRPAIADFRPGLPACRLPAACAVGGEAAHGFGGYAGQSQITAPCAPGTKPGRGKSQAIEHNRALHKAGQSLRWASLDGLPLPRPAGSCNGRLCLAPRPGQWLFWLAALRPFIRALRAWWSGGRPPGRAILARLIHAPG